MKTEQEIEFDYVIDQVKPSEATAIEIKKHDTKGRFIESVEVEMTLENLPLIRAYLDLFEKSIVEKIAR